ncbi:MAG: SH3 domain-containing protein [Pyrinomonadaceae bacterium]
MRRIALSFLVVAITSLCVMSQERFVKPVDEASQDASFLEFRSRLIAAAERKDLKYIQSIMDPKIELSFGGDVGLAGFRRVWKKPADFWPEFLAVLKNGGRFVGEGKNKMNSFSAPYLFVDMPEDLDVFEYYAVFGNNVNLRERPTADSPVVAQLSYNVLKIDEPAAVKRKTGTGKDDWAYDWHKIETLGGQKGWMKAEFVRSSIDLRAGFEKKRGRWVMTFFLAGD